MFELNLDIDHFLDTYWQKKPTVIKQGFIDFNDPILSDEIASLAMEEEIESRLIYKKQDEWVVESGPFDDFSPLKEKAASLLIQAVDHWHAESQELLRPFRFLPNWRIDDLIITYSTPKGGVRQQINNYDLFIIQGSGKRHWRVGNKTTQQELPSNSELQHGQHFPAILDVDLEAGDILYIPCGYPHQGETINTSISYSVTCRAPDQNELVSHFADALLDKADISPRYQDINMQQREKPGQIEEQEVNELHRLMLNQWQTPRELIPWLGKMLSERKRALDIAEIQTPHNATEILNLFRKGAQFTRLGGLRALYFAQSPTLIFINGEQFSCAGFPELGHYLCDQDEIGSELFSLINNNIEALNLFTQLVNLGYWYAL